jgi:hypothetical protein
MLIGGLCLLLAPGLVFAGVYQPAVPCFVFGLILTVGMLFEPWRYKRLGPKPGGRAEPTGERFIDPETKQLTEVYYDPATGERSYVRLEK